MAALFIACGPPPVVTPDGSVMEQDAGVLDAGETDAGEGEDAGLVDAGAQDAGVADSGVVDAGSHDAGSPDAGGFDAGLPDAGLPDGGPTGCPTPTGVLAPYRLRAMAANLTSGNGQSYDPGHGTRIMQGVQPDIVMIQEFKFGANNDTAIAQYVADTFGAGFDWWRGVGSIPNGVISRWPIVAEGEWNGQAPDRELTWAKIDLPGPNDVFVISVHFLTSNANDRNLDARTIMQQLDAGVSRYDYVLLGGDFNTRTFSESAFSTLAPRFKTSAPYPVDQAGNTDTSQQRDDPYDHVLASTCLATVQVPTVLGSTTFTNGAVIDTRLFTGGTITDIAPAMLNDSAASNMQHMGVVKDFLISP
ncbi:MAG: endonuclease/exonuclease/phosphatase family protein [Archangium sp.]